MSSPVLPSRRLSPIQKWECIKGLSLFDPCFKNSLRWLSFGSAKSAPRARHYKIKSPGGLFKDIISLWWPNNDVWRQISGSTLAHVIAWCLTALEWKFPVSGVGWCAGAEWWPMASLVDVSKEACHWRHFWDGCRPAETCYKLCHLIQAFNSDSVIGPGAKSLALTWMILYRFDNASRWPREGGPFSFRAISFFRSMGNLLPLTTGGTGYTYQIKGYVARNNFCNKHCRTLNLNQGGEWNRRPAGRQHSGLRNPRVHGNLILF